MWFIHTPPEFRSHTGFLCLQSGVKFFAVDDEKLAPPARDDVYTIVCLDLEHGEGGLFGEQGLKLLGVGPEAVAAEFG